MKDFVLNRNINKSKIKKLSVSFMIRLFIYSLLIGLVFVFLYPFLYMIVTSFKSPADLNDISVKWILNDLRFENYKTAYSLKRLDYIETVFDDDAVIIVANVASKATFSREGDGNLSMQNNQVIKHNRYTKDQYLRNLKRCFSSNEFINIRFANNDVIKLGKGGETYAIQISQDYYSSNYGDKGYLFLIVDINDINKITF